MNTSYISAMEVVQRMEPNKKYNGISTGLKEVDNILSGGVGRGTYVLGALASMGKTTFALQLAAEMARQGHPVLYLSLEQSPDILAAKIMSRETWLLDRSSACTVKEILTDKEKTKYVKKIAEESKTLELIAFAELKTDNVLEELETTISSYTEQYKNYPIVFVDYLQLLSAYGKNATQKANVDETVIRLCNFAREKGITLFLISSLNRASYGSATNMSAMSAFKESGIIEYAADVLLTLGLETTKKKAEDFRSEVGKEKRSMVLRVLKNKIGQAGGSAKLQYEPKYNTFHEQNHTHLV